MKQIKHIDEVRCKLCKAVYPDESDQIHPIWLYDKDTNAEDFIGHFCEYCMPASAHLNNQQSYIIDKQG